MLRNLYRLISTKMSRTASGPEGTANSAPETVAPTDSDVRLAALERELSTVYAALYEMAHDNDHAAAFAVRRTVAAFGHQWTSIPEGKFMLSDPVFKAEVGQIISDQELLVDAAWFPGKLVLDAGCGGGRWSYGLATLGAKITAVDTNPSALAATRAALVEIDARAEFLLSPLEELDKKLPAESFDLVWSWGVLHHCSSFTDSLRTLTALLKPGGLLHLYLYGRESIDFAADVSLFRERMRYNYLATRPERDAFLAAKAAGHGIDVHHVHDIYAPLINRRYRFAEIREILERLGFTRIGQPIVHSEVWVTAVKGPDARVLDDYGLPGHPPPYWFERTT